MPPAYRSQKIDHQGVKLYLETWGEGPQQILFVHGWMSSGRIWREMLKYLDPSQFTLHLLDQRGAGQSDRPLVGHDLEGYEADLRFVIRQLACPLVLVGHSAGGKIIQKLALDPPPEILKIILVAPGSAKAYPKSRTHRERTIRSLGTHVLTRQFILIAMRQNVPERLVNLLVEDAFNSQFEARMGWYDQGRAADFSEKLHQIKLPCLIMAGSHDPLAPPSRVKPEVADLIQGSTYIVLEEGGHNLPVELPREIAEHIRRFVMS